MPAYYNEHDPAAAGWLRELIKRGLIAPGDVDDRDIQEITEHDLASYTQVHLFAGIGGWSYALRLAGWPDDKRVWTGSCPCQPFSCAGKHKGKKDERHVWPWMRYLMFRWHPVVTFGEQVASKDGREWFAGVRANLEALGYVVGASDLCAAGIASPHIRQRIYWVADTECSQPRVRESGVQKVEGFGWRRSANGREAGGLADAAPGRFGIDRSASGNAGHADKLRAAFVGLGHTVKPGLERHAGNGKDGGEPGRYDTGPQRHAAAPSSAGDFWSRFDILPFEDEKVRRVEPGTFPLADGTSGRVGLLRGYGNAIVPQLAAHFIQAYCEVRN